MEVYTKRREMSIVLLEFFRGQREKIPPGPSGRRGEAWGSGPQLVRRGSVNADGAAESLDDPGTAGIPRRRAAGTQISKLPRLRCGSSMAVSLCYAIGNPIDCTIRFTKGYSPLPAYRRVPSPAGKPQKGPSFPGFFRQSACKMGEKWYTKLLSSILRLLERPAGGRVRGLRYV